MSQHSAGGRIYDIAARGICSVVTFMWHMHKLNKDVYVVESA